VTAPTDLEKVGLVLDRDQSVPYEKIDDDQTAVGFERRRVGLQRVDHFANRQELWRMRRLCERSALRQAQNGSYLERVDLVVERFEGHVFCRVSRRHLQVVHVSMATEKEDLEHFRSDLPFQPSFLTRILDQR
jgi:hypothetical protein